MDQTQDSDVVKSYQALDQFQGIFQSLQMTLDQHKAMAAAIEHVRKTIDRLDDADRDWARRFVEQTQEIKAEILTQAIDNGQDKTISL